MEQHEKLIKITPNCWHYRLIKYIWGIDPKMFMNLCPYFWLTIASLCIVPFVWVCRGIAKFFNKIGNWIDDYIDKISDKELENFAKTLNVAQIIEIRENGYDCDSTRDCDVNLPSSIKKKHGYYGVIYTWLKLHNMTEESLMNYKPQWEQFKKKKQEERILRERKILIKEKKKEELLDKVKQDREKINKVIKHTKHITGFIITALMAFLFFFVIKMFVFIFVLLTEFIIYDLVVTSTAIAIILGVILFGLIIAFYCKRVEGIVDRITEKQHASIKEWIIATPALIFLGTLYVVFYWIIYLFLWKWIIYATYKGLKNAFFTFTGIFGEYFGASYSDYCPGIEWDENVEVKN